MKCLLATAALCSIAVAQQPPQQLEQVARAQAYGGACSNILIAPDQRHALTVGDYGDLVWWDLRKRDVLLHILPIERYVSSIVIHPSSSWVAFGSSTGDWLGHVVGVDLCTGERFVISDDYARELAFDESGDSLSAHIRKDGEYGHVFYDVRQWRLGCPTPEREADSREGARRFAAHVHKAERQRTGSSGSCTSRDGAHFARWKSNALLTSFGDCTIATAAETWIEQVAVSDEGTALTSDAIGLLHLLDNQSPIDQQAETRAPFAPHLGHADRMVFSPDGRHLAIQGLCAARIVALDGSVELQLAGPHLIEPGEDGSEFRIADRHRCYRWNAGTRTEVGEPRCWQVTKPGFLRSGSIFQERGPCSVWRVREGIMAADDRRVPPDHLVLDVLPRPEADWHAIALREWFCTPVNMHRIGRSGAHLLHITTSNPLADSVNVFYLLDADGNVAHHTRQPTWHDWLAVDAPRERIWLGGGKLHCLSTKDLTPITSFEPAHKWLQAVTWQGGDLLMTDGDLLHIVEPMEEEVRRTFARPTDLAAIDVIAASPDHRHIAVADDYDVRILRVVD